MALVGATGAEGALRALVEERTALLRRVRDLEGECYALAVRAESAEARLDRVSAAMATAAEAAVGIAEIARASL